MQTVLGAIAYIVLVAFLAVLVIHVPRLDLICLVAVTVVLAGWDFIVNVKEHKD